MDWNSENTMLFIRLIRERPVLWDTDSADYNDKYKRNDAFQEVSERIGITIQESYAKWRSLRGQYTREKKRILGIQFQRGTKAVPPPKWFAYNEMELMCGPGPLPESINFTPGKDDRGNIIWNKENTMTFIRMVHDRPAIWDKLSHEYRDKNYKSLAMEEVASRMSIPIKEALLKWSALRSQFSREKRRMIGLQSQRGLDEAPPPKWFAFSLMDKMCHYYGGNGNPTNNSNIGNLSQSDSFIDTDKSNVVKVEFTNSPPPGSPSSPPTESMSSPTVSLSPMPVTTTLSPPPNYQFPSWPSVSRMTTSNEDSPMMEPNTDPNDHLTAFGFYVAAQVRKFEPRFQIKAKLEINKLLFEMEMEQLQGSSGGDDKQEST